MQSVSFPITIGEQEAEHEFIERVAIQYRLTCNPQVLCQQS